MLFGRNTVGHCITTALEKVLERVREEIRSRSVVFVRRGQRIDPVLLMWNFVLAVPV